MQDSNPTSVQHVQGDSIKIGGNQTVVARDLTNIKTMVMNVTEAKSSGKLVHFSRGYQHQHIFKKCLLLLFQVNFGHEHDRPI